MKINVIMDRPIGYLHGNIKYTVNYGYVPNIIGGDGAEQDVYVLDRDIDYPINKYCGELIAVIERDDDNETKWIASNQKWSAKEIYEKVKFVEQFFSSHVYLVEDYSADKLTEISELIIEEEV